MFAVNICTNSCSITFVNILCYFKELELTFSVDQDMFGEVRTTELCPGGKTIRVTNQNKSAKFYSYLK